MRILIFSPPFSGHLNVLLYLIDFLKDHDCLLVITGWENVPLPSFNKSIKFLEFRSHYISSSSPMNFTLDRV